MSLQIQTVSLNPPNTDSLKVVPILISDYPSVIKIARLWSEIAHKKISLISDDSDDPSIKQLYDCAFVAVSLGTTLSTSKLFQVSICQDSTGREQGIIVFKETPETIKIVWLVTHPRNIVSSANDGETEKVRGAGSALLKHAESRAQELNKKQVVIDPLPNSVPFYLKMGYQTKYGLMVKTLNKTEKAASFIEKVA